MKYRSLIKGMIKVLLLSCAAVALMACASNRHEPQLNPYPKHFLTIKGYIAPELKGRIYLSFVQSYITTADACFHVTNSWAGSEEGSIKNDIYRPELDKQGHYQLHIAIDKYLPGVCKWVAWNLGYSLTSSPKEPSSGEGFIDYGNSADSIPRFYNLVCKDNPSDCRIKIPKGTYSSFTINPNNSYTINLNLLYRKNNANHP